MVQIFFILPVAVAINMLYNISTKKEKERETDMSADKRQALSQYESYKRSSTTTLREVYGSYSSAKAKAYEYCRNLMAEKNGHGFRIISANGWMFTAGFMFEEDGKQMFMYITKSKNSAVEIKE
jgi:hypothetical protein